jgi:hypothetical protein
LLAETRGCPAHVAREATEALAIHHEHRIRDLDRARAFALRSLEALPAPARVRAVQHRLARLERKLKLNLEVRHLNWTLNFEPGT